MSEHDHTAALLLGLGWRLARPPLPAPARPARAPAPAQAERLAAELRRAGWRVDEPAQAAAVLRASPGRGAVVLANPIAEADQLDPSLHDRALARGLDAADDAGMAGKDVTPFLLDHLRAETGGDSLEANISLVVANARLAAEVAAHL